MWVALRVVNNSNKGLFKYLSNSAKSPEIHDNNINSLYKFLESKKDIIGSGTLQKAIRFLKDTIDSADNLIGIHTHRTPISLRIYFGLILKN